MAARTKAAKLKAKRGRPQLPAADRQPNGQPSRRKASITKRNEEYSMDAMAPAINRRVREYRLVDKKRDGKLETAEKQATDPMRGYSLGLLFLDGRITKRQHDAGIKFSEAMARYYGLTGVPFPSARAQNLFSIRSDGDDPQSRIDAAKAAKLKMAALRDTLLKTGDIDTGRRVLSAVMSAAVEDITECRTWPEHMMLFLRKGLNRVGDSYGLPG